MEVIFLGLGVAAVGLLAAILGGVLALYTKQD